MYSDNKIRNVIHLFIYTPLLFFLREIMCYCPNLSVQKYDWCVPRDSSHAHERKLATRGAVKEKKIILHRYTARDMHTTVVLGTAVTSVRVRLHKNN